MQIVMVKTILKILLLSKWFSASRSFWHLLLSNWEGIPYRINVKYFIMSNHRCGTGDLLGEGTGFYHLPGFEDNVMVSTPIPMFRFLRSPFVMVECEFNKLCTMEDKAHCDQVNTVHFNSPLPIKAACHQLRSVMSNQLSACKTDYTDLCLLLNLCRGVGVLQVIITRSNDQVIWLASCLGKVICACVDCCYVMVNC